MNIFSKRTGALFLLVLGELIILFLLRNGDGAYLKASGQTVNAFLREQGGIEFLLVISIRSAARVEFIAYLIFSVILVLNGVRNKTSFISLDQLKIGRFTLAINAACFFSLLSLFFVFQNPVALIANPYSLQSLVYALSPLIWWLYLYSICDLVFPVKRMLRLLATDFRLIFPVLLIVVLIFNSDIFEIFINFWSDLLFGPTIQLSSAISRVFGLNYQVLPDLVDGMPTFGTSQFKVGIYPGCSGYEGMTLIALLLGAYCYLQRGTLRIVRALWIIPIAGLMMFALNGLRIFILVAIGHYWSPEAALNGFHTVGGWLNLLLVFIASLLALNYMPFFQQHAQSKSAFELGDKALLAPLMAMIGGGLFVKVLSSDFAWLYPIPILLAAFTVFYFRKCFFTFLFRPSIVSLAIGVVVFVVWIYLIPENPPQSAHFIEQLTSAPLWLAVLWLLCRVVGACLVVPLA